MNISEDKPPVIDSVPAFSIEAGDQVVIEDDYIEVTQVLETEDLDEIVVKGYSHVSGDTETYSLLADDVYDVWAL